jgi:DNA-binding MarR family transcriptional regulator
MAATTGKIARRVRFSRVARAANFRQRFVCRATFKQQRATPSPRGDGSKEMSTELANGGAEGMVLDRVGTAALKLEQFLPYRINVVASVVSQALSRIYAERYGIGVPEWRVLVTLGEYGTMTGKAVGAHSHMHKTKVSRAVALLEKRKLVMRRTNRADLRESFLSLTTTGREIYEDLTPIALDFAKRLEEGIPAADRAAFERAIKGLTERSATLTSEFCKAGFSKAARED